MLSVVIPTKDRADCLDRLFLALSKQSLETSSFEILLVDNGSSDKTKDIVENWKGRFQNFRYFFEESPGLHVGRHIGLREADGDILVYADDDIEPFPSWLSSIQSAFHDPETMLVGGKCLPKFETDPPDWIRNLWKPDINGDRNLGYLSLIDLGDSIKVISPYMVFGCNFSIRKKLLKSLNGFHPDAVPQHLIRYRGDGETYISRYLAENLLKAIYHPGASVYHWVPRKRLYIEYFYRRAFNQGVSDSFFKIRDRYKKNQRNKRFRFSLLAPYKMLWVLLSKSRLIFAKIKKLLTIDNQDVNQILESAYQAGYIYHQKEVRLDPDLYAWVIKDDYLEAMIPE